MLGKTDNKRRDYCFYKFITYCFYIYLHILILFCQITVTIKPYFIILNLSGKKLTYTFTLLHYFPVKHPVSKGNRGS